MNNNNNIASATAKVVCGGADNRVPRGKGIDQTVRAGGKQQVNKRDKRVGRRWAERRYHGMM